MSHPLTQSVIDFLHSVPRFDSTRATALVIDGEAVGWLTEDMCQRLLAAQAPAGLPAWQSRPGALQLTTRGHDRSQVVTGYAEAMRDQGLLQNWRDERMDLVVGDRLFLTTERAAFRALGLATRSVHMNGWVSHPDGVHLWVAERSAHKFVDPGCLDNLVGGGVASGESLALALRREAWEEAGLRLRQVSHPSRFLRVQRAIREGIQQECIAVHDLWLPAHCQPRNQDGEVAAVRCLPVQEALALLLAGRFTWDAAIVIIAGLLRQHHFGRDQDRVAGAFDRCCT